MSLRPKLMSPTWKRMGPKFWKIPSSEEHLSDTSSITIFCIKLLIISKTVNFETKKQIQGYHYLVCLHIGYKCLLHECNLLQNFNFIQVNDNIIVDIRIASLIILLLTSELRAVDLLLFKFRVVCFGSSFNTLFRRHYFCIIYD